MVNPLLGKLFGSMLECRNNNWAEKEGKREEGQASFRPRNSTIDRCITLRHFIENLWDIQARRPFAASLTSRKLLTLSLEIRSGEEWKSSDFQGSIEQLYINFMRKLALKSELRKAFLNALVVT